MKHTMSTWLCALLLLGSSAAIAESELQTREIAPIGKSTVSIAQTSAASDEAAEVPEDKAEADDDKSTEPAMVSELAQQIATLDDRQREQIKQLLGPLNQGVNVDLQVPHGQGIGETITAVVAISLTVGMPVIIVALVLVAGHRKRKQQVALIEKYLDAGKDVPPEVLSSLDRDTAGGNNLRRGLILTGTGIGLFLFLGFVAGWEESTIGLIPLFIGLAQLLIWKIENAGKEKAVQS